MIVHRLQIPVHLGHSALVQQCQPQVQQALPYKGQKPCTIVLTNAKQSLVKGSPLCSVLTTSGTYTDKAKGQARCFLNEELDCPSVEDKYEGVIKFMVVRVERQ